MSIEKIKCKFSASIDFVSSAVGGNNSILAKLIDFLDAEIRDRYDTEKTRGTDTKMKKGEIDGTKLLRKLMDSG